MTNKQRAGQYVPQPAGYPAFLPTPLPPDPPVAMDDEMQGLLSRADRALGRLDGSIQTLPAPNIFVFMYVRKEAVLSSQIEGTQSSLNDLLEAEAKLFRADRPKDVEEVINYVAAMNHGLRRLESLPVSVRLIREIHEKLLENVRGAEQQPGELRRGQNWIGPDGSTLTNATFVPPPPEIVPEALSELERFLHRDDPTPMLIKIALAHAQFETIHPFNDGNGRVGRLLIAFLLCERRILTLPVLYISHYLKGHRDRYYHLLQSVRDEGAWEDWIKFFLTAITEVSQEATDTARRIVDLRERHRAVIVKHFKRAAANGLTVLESLYEGPVIGVNDIARRTEVSFTAANHLMSRFVKHGILQEITGQARNRLFRYTDYVELFAER